MNIRGKRVLVMGLGIHGGGLGVTKWLLRQGATVTVTDLKNAEALAPSLQALKDLPVRYVLGEHRAEDIVSTDLIVRGPGVPRESEWLKLARDRGIPIEMEMGLFFAELPRASKQVIGITGTKGKTTTTLMVGAILGNANPKTIIAGNLRISAMELLERIDAETTVILELSSWQLEGLEPLRQSPHIAAITNVSPDHLNRYRDFDDYAESKAVIFRYQQPDDFLVLNFDDPILTRFAPQAFSQVVWTSAKQLLQQGAYLEGQTLIWRWDGHKQPIIDLDRLLFTGHNVQNALSAIAVSSVWGASPEQIASALADFKGVEHRQELVREVQGVRYVNDTTATTPTATIAAIDVFSRNGVGVILIAGGSDKGLDYAAMADAVVKKAKKVLLLEGAATDRLAEAIRKAGGKDLVAGRFGDLRTAVERAQTLAQRGDVVLMSPGCASFGMFANEFERGSLFRQIVNSL